MSNNFTKAFFAENPILTLLLGLCPALAVSNEAINGLGMGVATLFVLLGSNIVVSLLKNAIPDKIRIPSYIIIIASFVTIIKMVMNAFVIDLYIALGIFIPLIVVNCMILGRAEAFASKNSTWDSFVDGLGMGLSFTITLTIIATIREILGSGTINLALNYGGEPIGKKFDLNPFIKMMGLEIAGQSSPLLVFILPAGGFIVLGIIIAAFNKINEMLPASEEEEEDLAEPVAASNN